MRLTLLAATVVLALTACGKPNQALPEQEKENFEKIMSQQQSSAPAETDAAGSDASSDADANQ